MTFNLLYTRGVKRRGEMSSSPVSAETDVIDLATAYEINQWMLAVLTGLRWRGRVPIGKDVSCMLSVVTATDLDGQSISDEALIFWGRDSRTVVTRPFWTGPVQLTFRNGRSLERTNPEDVLECAMLLSVVPEG